jgi:hypothetical protein
LSLASSAKKHCDGNACLPKSRHDIDSSKTFANVANVAFGVGVVALGVGAWQLFSHRTPKTPDKIAKSAELEAQIGLGSVAVTGSF